VPAGSNGRQVQRKQTGPPGICANSQVITIESTPVLPLEERSPNTLRVKNKNSKKYNKKKSEFVSK